MKIAKNVFAVIGVLSTVLVGVIAVTCLLEENSFDSYDED